VPQAPSSEAPAVQPPSEPQPAQPPPAEPQAPAPPPPPAQPAPPPAVEPPAPTAPAIDEGRDYEQRGRSLYIRLAMGFGIPLGSDIADDYTLRGGRSLSFSGGSFATDWMGGSMVLPWLAIGVGALSDTVVSGSVHYADDSKRSLSTHLYYFVLGPFVDAYFAPPAGWHVQLMLGLAHISRADQLSRGATGFGTVLGVGYDFAVAPRWNIGALARLAFSPLSMKATAGEKPSPSVYEPGLLFTATFRPVH
jgi:hypothetical protein